MKTAPCFTEGVECSRQGKVNYGVPIGESRLSACLVEKKKRRLVRPTSKKRHKQPQRGSQTSTWETNTVTGLKAFGGQGSADREEKGRKSAKDNKKRNEPETGIRHREGVMGTGCTGKCGLADEKSLGGVHYSRACVFKTGEKTRQRTETKKTQKGKVKKINVSHQDTPFCYRDVPEVTFRKDGVGKRRMGFRLRTIARVLLG